MDRIERSRCFLKAGAATRVLDEALLRPSSKTFGRTLIDSKRGGAVAPPKPALSIFHLKTILEVTHTSSGADSGPII